MSSHSITMFSPTLNCDVDICVGFDSALSEAFISFESPVRDYMSHGKRDVAKIEALALEKLGIELPAEMIAAVERDIIDTRMGHGVEVNQRFRQYPAVSNTEPAALAAA